MASPKIIKAPTKEEIAKSGFGNGSFGDAIRYMKTGGSVRRSCWPQSVTLYLKNDTFMKKGKESEFVYDALHNDLLAKDWSSI